MKKYIIGILLLVLVLSFQGVFADGTCGTNVKYTINDSRIIFSRVNTGSAAEWSENCGSVFKNDPKITIVKVNSVIRVANGSELFKDFVYVKEMLLPKLDVSAAADLSGMFYGCKALTSLNVSGWDTSSVKDMSNMFYGCESLTSLNLNRWNTSAVTNMKSMFHGCGQLASLIISDWNTSKVTDMYGMFQGCESLKDPDVSKWKTSQVTEMSYMFKNCSSLAALNVSGWDTGKVTNMSEMFNGCGSLASLDVSNWNTAKVTNMSKMFYGCFVLTSLDADKCNTASVTNMTSMFYNCQKLKKVEAGGWNTAKVKNMANMFAGCSALASLDVSKWNTAGVTSFSKMFYNCGSLKKIDVKNWNTAKATDMSYMFSGCKSAADLDVSKWKTSGVVKMSYMFDGCSSLASLEMSGWNVSNVTNMTGMFRKCSSLTKLDVSGWNTSKVKDAENIFSNCSVLNTLNLGKNTLKTNIFTTLPNYNGSWYYIAPGEAAGSPLPTGSVKKSGALFTAYDYNTMAGFWSTEKNNTISFVNRCYELILGRKADASGIQYWTNRLISGDITAAELMEGFVYSKEFLGKKYSNEKVAEILYRTMLDRDAEASGKAYWAGLLNDGVSYRYIINGFASSKEFKTLCSANKITVGTITLTENRDKNLKVTQFISRNYKLTLVRGGDAEGLNYWTGKILTKSMTPQQVAYEFVFSKECVKRNLNNQDFVKMLYNLFMDRNADQSGLNYWVDKLSRDMSKQQVANSFGNSPEFKKIVASYGL